MSTSGSHYHFTGGNTATDQQTSFAKQATILRKNIVGWNTMLHTPRGEDWPKMLGRANAAMNQVTNLNTCIQDVMEHFVIVPKQATANPSDIPFFLATKLDISTTTTTTTKDGKNGGDSGGDGGGGGPSSSSNTQEEDLADVVGVVFTTNPIHILSMYETNTARIAQEYEEEMVRF